MIWRNVTTFVFAILLAVTSVTLALGQHAMARGTQMVICSDQGVQTVVLDENGTPIQPDHSCIDCAAAPFAQDVPTALHLPLPPLVVQDSHRLATAGRALGRALLQTHARGPPFG